MRLAGLIAIVLLSGMTSGRPFFAESTQSSPAGRHVIVSLFDPGGNALAFERVRLKRVGAFPVGETKTDRFGVATFTDLDAGLYQAEAGVHGFSPRTAERLIVTDRSGDGARLVVVLGPMSECIFQPEGAYDDTPRDGHVDWIDLAKPIAVPRDRGSIYGRVTDAAGHPVSSARIRARADRDGAVVERRSEQSGEFGIGRRDPGSYRLSVYAAGYEPRSVLVQVVAGHHSPVTIALDEAADIREGIPAALRAQLKADDLPINIETGRGRIVVALAPGTAREALLGAIDTHSFDDAHIARDEGGADAPLRVHAMPYYFHLDCQQRHPYAPTKPVLELAVDGDRITLGAATGSATGRILEGREVADILRTLPAGRRRSFPFALLAISRMSHSSKTR